MQEGQGIGKDQRRPRHREGRGDAQTTQRTRRTEHRTRPTKRDKHRRGKQGTTTRVRSTEEVESDRRTCGAKAPLSWVGPGKPSLAQAPRGQTPGEGVTRQPP